MSNVVRPFDKEKLRTSFLESVPFPWFKIDGFLDDEFAHLVAGAYPNYEAARTIGLEFTAARERLKIQVSDPSRFPDPVRRLADALANPSFLADLEYITGIPKLLADAEFAGAGMHLTGSGGRLDVHVDFNFLEDRKLYRRLNILIYLNKRWEESWGGSLELWNSDVTRRHESFAPIFNRCVVFETSDISYHGVTPISAPPQIVRQSFAGYYYTSEPPARWDGTSHSTVFRSRPTERLRGTVLTLSDALRNQVGRRAKRLARAISRKFT
jgi:hypothetical protein